MIPTTLTRLACLALAPLFLLAACDKAQQAVTEKAVEKLIESQVEKDGSTAKVDLSEGKAKITTTDAQGHTTVMEMGGAKIDTADFGVPLYPGAQAVDKDNQRIQTPEQRMLTAVFESRDSTEQIAGFYRDKLRAMSTGKTLLDNATDQEVTLILADEKSELSLMVNVRAEDDTRRITLTSVAKSTHKP